MEVKILNGEHGIGKEELFHVIYRIENQWPDSMAKDIPGLKAYSDKIYEKSCVLGVVVDNEIQGIAAVYVNDKETFKAYLTYIALMEGATGRGMGKVLLKHCEIIAKNQGMFYLKLEVKNANLRAMTFYRKNDYSVIEEASELSVYMEKSLH